MPEMTKYEPGTPSWVDLSTPDPVDGSRFYSGLFGWSIDEGPPEAGGYRMCMLDGKPVAGLAPQVNIETPPCWMTYINVADADETAAAVKQDGGTIIAEPFEVMDVGRMAIAADPAGAIFTIWQPRTHIGAGLANDANTWCWNELTTREPQKSVEFYGAVFGWNAHLLPAAGPADYIEFQVGARGIAGMMPIEGDAWPAEMPNHWMVYFAVDDCAAAVAKAEELAGKVIVPPTEVPPGTFAVLNDPQGAAFSVIKFNQQPD